MVGPTHPDFKPSLLGEKSAHEFYLYYCQVRKVEPLPFVLWQAVTRQANQEVATHLIESGETVTLPYGLGRLMVYRQKVNFEKPSIDWYQTRLQGRRCYHVNAHSNFFSARLHWEKLTCTFRHCGFYAFRLVRNRSREISAQMKVMDGYLIYQLKPTPTLRFRKNKPTT